MVSGFPEKNRNENQKRQQKSLRFSYKYKFRTRNENQKRQLKSLRFSYKYKLILSFLFRLGQEATKPQFFELLGIPHPVSHNEYVKLNSTLLNMERDGLLKRIKSPWHNQTAWEITTEAIPHGKRFAEKNQQEVNIYKRQVKLLRNKRLSSRYKKLDKGEKEVKG